MKLQSTMLALALFAAFAVNAAAQDDKPYVQHQNVVYGEAHGVGLLMDIFEPTGDRNGRAIVDVVSGAYYSDRGKLRDHERARLFDIFCSKGYVVFAARPGSVSHFTGDEMIRHVERAIRYAKHRAADFNVDPENLGIMGASAGGHLASLAALTPKPGKPDANDPVDRYDTSVDAAGVFFPPTDFLNWNGEKRSLKTIEGLLFNDGIDGKPEDEVEAKAREISPFHNVNGAAVPFLIFHGDADTVVPLQQSEILVEKLETAGSDVRLVVKAGGGHPWFTIYEEVAVLADWFDGHLLDG